MNKLLLLALGIPGVSMAVLVAAATEGGLPGINELFLPVIVIFILVLINGFFVAAEFAIIGVRATQIEHLSEEGNLLARNVFSILNSRKKQDQYIATAQMGITVASLGLAMYGEPAIGHFIEPYLARLLGVEPEAAVVLTVSYLVALGLLTYLHIVVGEMVPKSLALMDSLRVVLFINRPMMIVQTILRWPVHLLNGIGNLLLRLFKIPPAQGHARVLSPEELELIVSESTEGGLLKEEEEELIRNIFDFGDRVVAQVMTPRTRVQAIPADISREALLKLVTESGHSRFPVYKNDRDHIVGILHIKDLMRQTLRATGAFDMRLILRSAPAVPEDQPVEALLAAFKRQKLHMAIVLDEFGGMAGIVTLEDLVEEIVGEVRDEFDQEAEPFVEVEPGVIEVSGEYLVDDLVEDVYLGDETSLPDVDTVGGLVITKLGRPPRVGDEVVYNNHVRFIVLSVAKRAAIRIRVEFPVPGQEPFAPDEAEQDHDSHDRPK